MGDKFVNFAALSDHYQGREDYLIQLENRGGKILILAPHGGGIERGTSELVRAIAFNDYSYYLFEGRFPTYHENQTLHITSRHFDEPKCLDLIEQFDASLAIHGCRGPEQMIHVGGRDSQLGNLIFTGLGQKGYPVQIRTKGYEGICTDNICNRTRSGQGIQLELSTEFRRRLFYNWKKRLGRKNTTELFTRFVSDIRDMIE